MKKLTLIFGQACFFLTLSAQQMATITIDADKKGNEISTTLHGIFFEEISHAGEGGLYAEMIQNRGFEETRIPAGTSLKNGFLVPNPGKPHFMLEPKTTDWKLEWPHKTDWPAWSAATVGNTAMKLSLVKEKPLNSATPNSLRIDISNFSSTGKAELRNEGFWGINIQSGDEYRFSLYARANEAYNKPLTVSLRSPGGKVLATHSFDNIKGAEWKKYACTFKPTASDEKAQLVFSFNGNGSVWVDFVSLFPVKTFKNRPNGLRNDLAELIAGLQPSFVRWPGGCYVEGITIESAPDWKNTIGPIEKRPGTFSPWGYWSSDGFGYHEYLQFCEDINADALYVFNAGVSCEYRSGTYVPESELQPYIQNALDAIEYAMGPVTSPYGKLRAANGHPKPFPLKYVEIGNEQHGPKYASRYNVFYKAIKEKYPQIRLMASMGIGDVNQRTLKDMKEVDIVDEHAYKDAYWSRRNTDHFDNYKRGDWDMYVGEYATNSGVGAGNMQAALSDAVYIMSMERNADLVKWSSYAPLLVNVNDVDWPVNLINFDAAKSFGRISYYAIKMLAANRADINLATSLDINKPKNENPMFSGSIGLGTWDTQAEFKDIEVIQNGTVVYKSDLLKKPTEWNLVRGHWKVNDGTLSQQAEGPQLFAMLDNRNFDTYTLKLKARKTGGLNAFMIPFAVKDSNTYLRAHIGSWWNSHCVFDGIENGYEVAGLTDQKRLTAPIETGRWYDVRLEVGLDKVDCFLNDTLLMTYRQPPALFAISGRDRTTGDIIVKFVNTSDEAASSKVVINGNVSTDTQAELIVLSAGELKAENSLTGPRQYIPRAKKIVINGNVFEMSWQPYSINVLRIKDTSWKK